MGSFQQFPVRATVALRGFKSTSEMCWLFMSQKKKKTVLCWNWETDTRQCLQMEVFWLCKPSVPLSVPALPCVYMKTLPIYLNCVRCCVAKIFLNQRIHPVRVSVYLSIDVSIYLPCLSVRLFLHAFYSKPNALESIRNRSRTRPPSSQSL